MAEAAKRTSRNRFFYLLTGLLLVACVSPASAVSYIKFYKGVAPGAVYTGPYSGAGTVYDNTKSLSTNCPDGGCGSGDRIGDPLTWTTLGLTATAPGTVTVNGIIRPKNVWDDLVPNFGGLGTGSTYEGSDADQIEGSDVLVLSLSSAIKLTGVGTLFDGPHTPFGAGYPTVSSISADAATIQFQMAVCLLGVCSSYTPISFALANSMGLSLIGDTFMFMQLTGNPSFYVSALSYESCGPTGGACTPPPGVPIPGALPLFASGLVGLTWLGLGRRRKRNTTPARSA
jgi:hypothetical protein